ncbi:MAG: glycosyltransferase family 39 protein [Elusimicrobia bacterium]|nr:glycosyltransferase family 39 protein [Elusimicrobiota bacterium]
MTPSSRKVWLAAAAAGLSLLVHAKGLRAPLLDYHFHRQVNTAAVARNYWRERRPLLEPRIDWEGPEDRLAATELPVYMWLYGKLWPILGLGESWGRILSAAASALTALFLFFLFDRELGTEAAFLGAGLFSFLPLEVYFGRTVQPEAAALLGGVAALYFWDRALERGRPWGPWLAATFCVFLAVGLKIAYAYLFVPLAGLTWRRLGRASWSDGRTWAAGLLSMAGVAAWYLYASQGVYVVPTHAGEFLNILEYRRLPYFLQFLVLSRFLELVLTYGGAVLFFFGAREVLLRRRDAFWIAWLGGAFLHIPALGAYGHSHEYTALPLVPVAAGLMGEGLRLLKARASSVPAPRRAWALAGVALLALAVPVHAALRVGHWYRQGFGYLARAREAAAAVSAPGDLFHTGCRAPSVALYYLDRRGWSNELETRTPADALGLIAARARQGARFLAVEKTGLFADPGGSLWRALRARSAPAWDDGALAIFPRSVSE